MNIVNERPGDAVQELRIEIVKKDYAEKVESALKKQRQKTVVPGFRPGNAPLGMVRKMYYKNFLAEEISELVGKAMQEYFQENKINILLEPLAIDEKSSVDFDRDENFIFTFEFALKPTFAMDYAGMPVITDFTVTASQNEIENYVKNLRQRLGNFISPDAIQGEEEFITVNYDGDHEGFIHFQNLNDEGKNLFTGKKRGDEVHFTLRGIYDNPEFMAWFLKIKPDDLEKEKEYAITGTIEHIGKMELAELNPDFFKKAFPDGSVNNEEEMRSKGKKEIEEQWVNETDSYFMNQATDTLMTHTEIPLPDDFIKRYLLHSQEGLTSENLEQEYENYKKAFQWQLIENHIAEEHGLKVTEDDIRDYVRNFFFTNYFSQFKLEDVEDQLNSIVKETLKDQEQVRKIYDMLFDKKLKAVLQEKMNVDRQTGDFQDFINLLKGKKTETEEPVKKKTSKPKAKKEEGQPEAAAEGVTVKKSTKKNVKKEE